MLSMFQLHLKPRSVTKQSEFLHWLTLSYSRLSTEINNTNISVQLIIIGVKRDAREYVPNVDCRQTLAATRVPHLDCAVDNVRAASVKYFICCTMIIRALTYRCCLKARSIRRGVLAAERGGPEVICKRTIAAPNTGAH